VLRHTRVLTGKIVRIDLAGRLAVFAPARGPERALRYDVLVLAAGSASRVLPAEGLAEYGAGFKTVGEAVHLRNHVLGQLAAAASAGDPAIRAAALTFVVAGGGFAGVEALAELQGLADAARAAAARRRRAAAHPACLGRARHGPAGRRDRTGRGNPGAGGRRAAEPAGRACRPDSGGRGPGRHRGTGRVRRRGHRGGAGPEPPR